MHRSTTTLRLGFSVVLLAGCGQAAAPPGEAPETTLGASPSETAPEHSCANPHGGVCLGPIEAGTYATKLFETPVTYTVPAGWANHEDLPGNMLLVPPVSSLDDVDAGEGDYIGLYDGVSAASGTCVEVPEASIEATPADIAAYFSAHEGLEATEPQAADLGGLAGLVIDLRIAAGYTGTCPYAYPPGAPLVPMFIGGAGPASVHHVVIPGIDTRLYLLEGRGGRVLAIEVNDHPTGPAMEELDAVVQTFRFADVNTAP